MKKFSELLMIVVLAIRIVVYAGELATVVTTPLPQEQPVRVWLISA